MIAALFVETNGVYFGLDNVDPWDKERDARNYAGPWPVVAHPPCERWGRYWSGGPSARVRRKLGDDEGCFEAALRAVRKWGGVLEHPADSHAWKAFALTPPRKSGGWCIADPFGGLACHVEQGHYGHFARKATWLYAYDTCAVMFDLRWGRGEQRLHPVALAKHGYEKARRIGMVAMIGGKDKKKIRDRTPIEFRDLLISIAHSRVSPRDAGVPPPAAGRAWPSEALPAPSPAAGLPQAVDSVSRASAASFPARLPKAATSSAANSPAAEV